MALIMVGVLILVSFPVQTSSSTESSTKETPACLGSTTVVNSTGGYPNCLKLTVDVNSTELAVGHSLQISVGLVNTLPYANNVSTMAVPPDYDAEGSWLFGGFPIFTWPDSCLGPFPLQFVVVEGNYTVGSLSAADDPHYFVGGTSCASGHSATLFTFGTDSDQVNVTAVTCTGICGSPFQLSTSYRLESNFAVMGYWNVTDARLHPLDVYTEKSPVGDGFTTPYPEVAPLGQIAFVPGVYTLAVSSFWGQAEAIQFTVK
jgi:hypothetical protein